jgi:hypothetical protein
MDNDTLQRVLVALETIDGMQKFWAEPSKGELETDDPFSLGYVQGKAIAYQYAAQIIRNALAPSTDAPATVQQN